MLGTVESLASLALALVSLAGLLLQDRKQGGSGPDEHGNTTRQPINRVLISISLLVVILFYLALANIAEQRAIATAQTDVEALLARRGPMSFEDIYAQISPPRDLTTLTAALDAGLWLDTIVAAPQRATLADNNLVGVRIYALGAATAAE